MTFTEVDGRTTLVNLVQAPSKEIRDAIIDSGMEAGMQDAMDLLDDVAVSLAEHPDGPSSSGSAVWGPIGPHTVSYARAAARTSTIAAS